MTTIPAADETILVGLIQDPATTKHGWANRAACVDLPMPGSLYFPDDGLLPPDEALACCAICPVALHCLATAFVHEAIDGERFGWWGGLGPPEREALWGILDLQGPLPADVGFRDPSAIARRLRAQRHTITAIAAELGCTERTVYRYLAASAA